MYSSQYASYYPDYGYYQQPMVENPSCISNLNISAPQTKPAPVAEPQSSLEDYIKRAFEKCITVADRLAMTSAINTITKLAKGPAGRAINWATYPLPLLDREKLIEKAKVVDEKLTKKQERLDRFKEDFTSASEPSSVHSSSLAAASLTSCL